MHGLLAWVASVCYLGINHTPITFGQFVLERQEHLIMHLSGLPDRQLYMPLVMMALYVGV
ncbi:hypothetical protein MBAV_001534 [Candidatus Magnetobacterium bavaricum]|uniref:Uncharacterized protein n=1 Tax=Candidatus Magnetobacterium bavaricum TaxID=29290 RepID=A0A0F3GWE4_9BACT|nr:hypothetical protein MBAV_001534 [Candidatus Magnetobacterium bavaricum]